MPSTTEIIKNLFDLDDYDEAKKELKSLIFRKNEFHPAIYEIIRKSISPRYKSFIYHLKDKRIEKTSNKIENAFQKTMPKSRKRIFKTTRGVLKRIYRRDLIWNDNRKKDFENQQSFWKSLNNTVFLRKADMMNPLKYCNFIMGSSIPLDAVNLNLNGTAIILI